MEFLKSVGFLENDIEEINDNISGNVLENLKLNQENVLEIISYLKTIGILNSTIKEIFIYQVGLFFKTRDEIKKSFDEYELSSIVNSINYDVNNIELIDFI